MLAVNPKARPSCDEILKHPWFSKVENITIDMIVRKFGKIDPNPEEE